MSYKDAKRTAIGKSASSKLWEKLIGDCNFSEKEFLKRNKDGNFNNKQLLEFYWAVSQIELPFENKI